MQTQRMVLGKPKLILLLFMCTIIFTFVNTWAYTPPIGIPDPGMWGTTHPIDSLAPDTKAKCPSWPAGQTANCYYIDNTHAQATDSSNAYGYPAKPRLTIPSQTYTAGAYIEVHGGPYTSNIAMTMQGTAENPIWFRGTSSTSMPDIRAKISIPNGTYVIVENLEFNNFTGTALSITGMAVHNICIRSCKFHDLAFPGSSTAVISSTPTQGGNIHDLVFYRNYFGDIGNWQATTDEDFHAINPDLWGRKPPTTQYNIWSLNNTAYHIAGSLNQFNGDQRDATTAVNEGRTETNLQNFHHMYSGKNLMYNSRQALGAPKFTTDAIYSQNVAYSNYSISSEAGSGQVFQEGSRYVWLLFNKYYDLTYGIRSSNTNFPGAETADLRAYMIGNVIYNINNARARDYVRTSAYKPNQAIGFEKAYYKRYVVDNTFYNVGGGINVGNQVAADITGISGNVFAGIYGVDINGNPDYHFSMLSIGGTTGTTMDRCFFQPRADNGKVTFKWAGATPSSSMESLTDLQSSSVAQCPNCWTGDPLFVDVANYDLHPKENSPLIGKGVRHPVYNEFQARYGINIAYDFEGKPRPQGAWTLGALEPGTLSMDLPPPPAPSASVVK
ncbi:MAG: hypothetical protein FD168_173 [Desulfobulbaceae bacterium]|nr:MAG: hypothetical protein FD168_173 [Desulfobulbaceae bacterium]